MTREEAIALGVPEEHLKEFQELYHRDLRKTAQRESGSASNLRAAIAGLLPVIKDADELRSILMLATEIYSRPKTEGSI